MSTPATLRDKLRERRDAERRDSLVSAAVAASRPAPVRLTPADTEASRAALVRAADRIRPVPIRATPPAVTHLEQASVTMRLLAVIEAGFGRSIAWDEAIAATLRAIGWTEDQVSGLFLAAETAP
jgi:hypothetical protein